VGVKHKPLCNRMQLRAPPSAIGTHASGVLAQNQHAGSVRTYLSLKGHYFE